MVRAAYNHRCAFCGCTFGGVTGIPSGVDAAHILAWSSFDLDVIPNGLSLCKLHHWAFDACLMTLEFNNGVYQIRFTNLIEQFELAVQNRLGTDASIIPESHLPTDPSLRPSPAYLDRLQADLNVPLLF